MSFKQIIFYALLGAGCSAAEVSQVDDLGCLEVAQVVSAKELPVELFKKSIVMPSAGMPDEVVANFVKVATLPEAMVRVNLRPVRAQKHLAIFTDPQSHAAFLKNTYFSSAFTQVSQTLLALLRSKNQSAGISLLLERARAEDSVVVTFNFEKKAQKTLCTVIFNACSAETVDADLVNLVQAMICDDSYVSRHWGKGTLAISTLLAVVLRKELPLGIGKSFQSFYEQAQREVARLYPGVFGPWTTFFHGAKFAKKLDDPRYVIILLSPQDRISFNSLINPQQLSIDFKNTIKALFSGCTKIAIISDEMVSQEFENNFRLLLGRGLQIDLLEEFPLQLTFEARSLAGLHGVAGNPLDFNNPLLVTKPLGQGLKPPYKRFVSLSDDDLLAQAENASSAQNYLSEVNISFEVDERVVSPEELAVSEKLGLRICLNRFEAKAYFKQKVVLQKVEENLYKLFEADEEHEFTTFAEAMEKIYSLAEPQLVDLQNISLDKALRATSNVKVLNSFFSEKVARFAGADHNQMGGWCLVKEGKPICYFGSRDSLLNSGNSFFNISFDPNSDVCFKPLTISGHDRLYKVFDQMVKIVETADKKIKLIGVGFEETYDSEIDLFTRIKGLMTDMVESSREVVFAQIKDGAEDLPSFAEMLRSCGSQRRFEYFLSRLNAQPQGEYYYNPYVELSLTKSQTKSQKVFVIASKERFFMYHDFSYLSLNFVDNEYLLGSQDTCLQKNIFLRGEKYYLQTCQYVEVYLNPAGGGRLIIQNEAENFSNDEHLLARIDQLAKQIAEKSAERYFLNDPTCFKAAGGAWEFICHLKREVGGVDITFSCEGFQEKTCSHGGTLPHVEIAVQGSVSEDDLQKTIPVQRNFFTHTSLFKVFDQKIIICSEDDGFKLVANGSKKKIETLWLFEQEFKEIASELKKSTTSETFESLLVASSLRSTEAVDRPHAYAGPVSNAASILACMADEEVETLPRNADGSVIMTNSDGIATTFSKEQVTALRSKRQVLKRFVDRMARENAVEAAEARKLLVNPVRNGTQFENAAWIFLNSPTRDFTVFSVDEFKKIEAFMCAASVKSDAEFAVDQQILKKYMKDMLKNGFVQCWLYDRIKLLAADPAAHVLARKVRPKEDLSSSIRLLTRAVLIAHQINNDPECKEMGITASEARLCLRPGATREDPIDDRFVVVIERKQLEFGTALSIEDIANLISGNAEKLALSQPFVPQTFPEALKSVQSQCSAAVKTATSRRLLLPVLKSNPDFVKFTMPALRFPEECFPEIDASEIEDFLKDRIRTLHTLNWKYDSQIKQRYVISRYLNELVSQGLVEQPMADRIRDFWFNEDVLFPLLHFSFEDRKEKFASIPLGTRVQRTWGKSGNERADESWREFLEAERVWLLNKVEDGFEESVQNTFSSEAAAGGGKT